LEVNSTASRLTSVGYQAGYYSTGAENTFVGFYAGLLTNSGAYNTVLGSQALYNNTTASNNTAVGYQAGYSNPDWVNSMLWATKQVTATTQTGQRHLAPSLWGNWRGSTQAVA
jgi:hypothetical protein